MKNLFIGSLLLVLVSCQTFHGHRVDTLKNIHKAAKAGDTKKVDAFLKTGVQVNVKDKNGNTPLHLAAQNEHLQVVKLLIKNGADVNIKNKKNQTPLNVAKDRKTKKSLLRSQKENRQPVSI